MIRLFMLIAMCFYSLFSCGQEIRTNELTFEKESYKPGENIRLSFHFENSGILHSNFGGCGNGAYYSIWDEQKKEYISGPIFCDVGLTEYYYETKGTINLQCHKSGTFSVHLYLHVKGKLLANEEDHFSHLISSPTFIVVANEKVNK